MRLPILTAALLATATLAPAQNVLLPSTATAGPGTTLDNASWGNNAPAGWTGYRMQFSYSHENFTERGIGGPIRISGLWFRSGNSAPFPLGGATITGAGVSMSTGRLAATALDTEFAYNHGPDETPVFYGQVQVQNTNVQGTLYVHIPLQTPFDYDWTAGDLLVDISYLYSGITYTPAGSRPRYGDAMLGRGGLVFGPSNAQYATNTYAGVPIVQFDYTNVLGAGTVTNRGTGCTDQRSSGFEQFTPGSHPLDLAGAPAARITYARQPDHYLVTRSGAGLVGTVGHQVLTLGDDTCSAPIALPFAFPYLDKNGVAHTTNQIVVASNGYLWLDGAQTVSDYSPTTAELLGQAPRIAAHWLDLAPNQGGTITCGSSGGTDFHVTWTAVPEYNHAANTVTAQITLSNSGTFRIDFGPTTPSAASLTGFSPGLGAMAAADVDLSAAAGLRLGRDAVPLAAVPVTRPTLGGTQVVRVDDIPGGTILGAMCLGLFQAQVDLSVIGMPGCTRWLTWDVTHLLLPNGNPSVNWQMTIPNNPSFVGLTLYEQAAMFAAGMNQLGIVTSNALTAVVGH